MRNILITATLSGAVLLAACSGPQKIATIPESGITSSNGGGQRALGDALDIGTTNGVTTQRALSRSGPGPTGY